MESQTNEDLIDTTTFIYQDTPPSPPLPQYTTEHHDHSHHNQQQQHIFHAADWVVFVLMLVMSVAIGVISAVRNRRNKTTQEFLLGGKNMPPIPVAISLLGGIISAISILGNPTEIYYYGTQITISLLGAVPGIIFVNKIVIPVFYNLQLVSLNEYMERRYHSIGLRKLSTLVTLLSLAVYMGMCLYAPSLALSTVTNISTLTSMIIMGAIVTFYITIGGVKAVVYTDVLQTALMFGGMLVVVVMCCIDLGGPAEVWDIAQRGGRLQFFNMDTNPFIRHTFWSTFIMGFFLVVSGIGINQTTYQRFASVRNVEISKGLGWFFLFGFWCLWCLFFFSGLVAYAVYSTCDPLSSGKIQKPDQIIPFMVTDKLGHIPGLTGLFASAVYGGVLSTLSSTGNSGACMLWEDILKPLPFFRNLSDSSAMQVVKILSSMTGVVGVALGALMGRMGNIFHVVITLTSAITAPLCGVFLAGILMPWVSAKGVFSGFVVSFSYNMWIVIGKFLRGGGSPPKLPLSVSGCGVSLNNATLLGESLFSTTTITATTSLEYTTINEPAHPDSIYDTSYCYNGLIGIGITMIIGGIVSFIIGPNCPKDVEGGVVNPTCERLYRDVWLRYNREGYQSVYQSQQDKERHRDNTEMTTNPSKLKKEDSHTS